MKKALILALCFGLGVSLYLVWALSVLLPPILVGVVLAYVFRPLKAKFHLSWLPHEMGVILAFSFIVLSSSLVLLKVKSYMPSPKEEIELKIRLNYKLNKKFEEIFEENSKSSLLKQIGKEIRPAITSISGLLELSPVEQDRLEKYRVSSLAEKKRISDRYYAYHQENVQRQPNAVLKFDEDGEIKSLSSDDSSHQESSTHLLYNLSIWSLCPLVFIFLIFDNGQIRRFIVGLVPNAYFEVTLTLLDRLDEALGLYLRGTAMECFLVALSAFAGLFLLGLPLPSVVLLSLLCGMLNAVPFLGPMLGGLAVLSYALIAEEVNPLIPFVSLESLPMASLLVVGFVQLLDNLLFAPVVLGRAVNLHPLVVIIALSAASLLFGVWGVVVTIPTIVVMKTIVHTLVTQFKAYRLI